MPLNLFSFYPLFSSLLSLPPHPHTHTDSTRPTTYSVHDEAMSLLLVFLSSQMYGFSSGSGILLQHILSLLYVRALHHYYITLTARHCFSIESGIQILVVTIPPPPPPTIERGILCIFAPFRFHPLYFASFCPFSASQQPGV